MKYIANDSCNNNINIIIKIIILDTKIDLLKDFTLLDDYEVIMSRFIVTVTADTLSYIDHVFIKHRRCKMDCVKLVQEWVNTQISKD